MKEYDIILIGAGTAGTTLLFKALPSNASIALVDKGPLGGTCLNSGCVPSKMLIYPADVAMFVRHAEKLGIKAEITGIDFPAIMERMHKTVDDGRGHIEQSVRDAENLDYYPAEARFVDEYTLEADGERIRGRKIFIASGSRDMIPPIKGLDTMAYLDTKTLLQLREKPESMIIIGGGYVGVEYGHFFSAMGTRVIILHAGERLVEHEEPEISELLLKELGSRMEVHTGINAVEAKRFDGKCVITAEDHEGRQREFSAQEVLVAAGRESNADILGVETTGVRTGEKDYIEVDDYLETSRRDIWAFGDAIDRLMFTHSGDREAELAWHNATNVRKKAMDFHSVPHAVYTWPRIASVGMTEEKARERHYILVGKANYSDIVMGEAMMEQEGFAKAIVEKNTGKILGFHIIGPEAPLLIQEVTNVIAVGGTMGDIQKGLHIFPSLAELVPEALGNLREVREFAGAHV